MNTSKFFFYDVATGIFSGASFEGTQGVARAQPVMADERVGIYAGEVDVYRQRLDVNTAQLVDYQPPQPANTKWAQHQWDQQTRTWLAMPTAEALAVAARASRDRLLASCDWTQVRDSPIGPQAQNAWQTYRAALRDLTAQDGFPVNVTWPTPPNTPTTTTPKAA